MRANFVRELFGGTDRSECGSDGGFELRGIDWREDAELGAGFEDVAAGEILSGDHYELRFFVRDDRGGEQQFGCDFSEWNVGGSDVGRSVERVYGSGGYVELGWEFAGCRGEVAGAKAPFLLAG